MSAATTTSAPDGARPGGWPREPGELDPTSELARRHAARERLDGGVIDLSHQARPLRERLDRYRRLIDAATSHTDLGELARADAGARLMEKLLKPLDQQIRAVREDAHGAAERFETQWAQYLALCEELAALYARHARNGPPEAEVAKLVERLRSLAGRPGRFGGDG